MAAAWAIASSCSATSKRGIPGRQLEIAPGNDILPALADHRDLDAAWEILAQLGERTAGKIVAQRNLAHMETLRLGGKFRRNPARHEIHAQDRADHPERICDRITGRRIAVVHDVKRRLQGGRAGQRAGVDAERVPDLDAKSLAESQRDQKSGDACHKRQQIVFSALCSGHPIEELSSVKDADAIEEHDQSGETDRSGDLRLRGKCADRQPDEQDSADPERKPEYVDLADEKADADGEKGGKDGLGANDLTSDIQHGEIPRLEHDPEKQKPVSDKIMFHQGERKRNRLSLKRLLSNARDTPLHETAQ